MATEAKRAGKAIAIGIEAVSTDLLTIKTKGLYFHIFLPTNLYINTYFCATAVKDVALAGKKTLAREAQIYHDKFVRDMNGTVTCKIPIGCLIAPSEKWGVRKESNINQDVKYLELEESLLEYPLSAVRVVVSVTLTFIFSTLHTYYQLTSILFHSRRLCIQYLFSRTTTPKRPVKSTWKRVCSGVRYLCITTRDPSFSDTYQQIRICGRLLCATSRLT